MVETYTEKVLTPPVVEFSTEKVVDERKNSKFKQQETYYNTRKYYQNTFVKDENTLLCTCVPDYYD